MKTFWFVALAFVVTTVGLALPPQAEAQSPQIVHYGDIRDGGKLPSFAGSLVAIRFQGPLGDYAQGLFFNKGVKDFVIAPPPMGGSRGTGASRSNVGGGSMLAGIMGQLTSGQRTNTNQGSSPASNDPCSIRGQVFVCVWITDPQFIGYYRDGNSISIFGRNSTSSSTNRQLERYEVSVRIDLVDSRGDGDPIVTPLGVSSKVAFSGNNQNWYSGNASRFGSYSSIDSSVPLNVSITGAAKKGLEELLQKGKGWRPGSAGVVERAKNASNDSEQDQ